MMMMRAFLMVLQVVGLAHEIAAASSSTCAEGAPFDCPEGTYCTQWNDGCNDCACNDTTDVAMCTLKMCPCLNDNTCVPTCKDNTSCTPKAEAEAEAEEPFGSTNLFTCPEGTFCKNWSDGCNTCFADTPDQSLAACTEMYCPCYDDNSCEPKCNDNPECVPATAAASGSNNQPEDIGAASGGADADVVADDEDDKVSSGAPAAAGRRNLVLWFGALLATGFGYGML